MYPSLGYFVEVWLSSSKEAQPWLVLNWTFWRQQEEIAYKRFLHRPIQEIERILLAYIVHTEVRQLLVSAGLSMDKIRKERGLRFLHIYINENGDIKERLYGFVHEILHVVCLEYGAHLPDESRLDYIAKMVVNNNFKRIERIFNGSISQG